MEGLVTVLTKKTASERKVANRLSLKDKIVLVLMRIKTYFTLEVLAWIFNIGKGTASNTINEMLPILHAHFSQFITIPKEREAFGGWIPKAFGSNLRTYAVVSVDGFEQSIYVPSVKEIELTVFSGKKKYTTLTRLIAITLDCKCCFLSEAYPGSIADAMLISFTENKEFLKKFDEDEAILFDAGFIGVHNHCAGVKANLIVSKKPSAVEGEEEKEYENLIKSYRVRVENFIAKIRSFNGLSMQLREKSLQRAKEVNNYMVTVAVGIINKYWM